MGKTARQIAQLGEVSTSRVYYYLKKRGLKKQANKYKIPVEYDDEIVELVLADIRNAKDKRLKDVTYWQNRTTRLEKENKLLKKEIKKFNEVRSAVNTIKQVAKKPNLKTTYEDGTKLKKAVRKVGKVK